jgi:hypothetical protein
VGFPRRYQTIIQAFHVSASPKDKTGNCPNIPTEAIAGPFLNLRERAELLVKIVGSGNEVPLFTVKTWWRIATNR